MRISDWSSDVCSSDLWDGRMTSMLVLLFLYAGFLALTMEGDGQGRGGSLSRGAAIYALVGAINIPINNRSELGQASGRERVGQYGCVLVVDVSLKKKQKQQ